MSTFNQLVLSERPTLFLSAPTTTDQSGTSLYALSNNALVAGGQPIIYGNDSSFVMNSTNHVDIDGNPIFFNNNTSFECVIVASKPVTEIPIVVDVDALNGLFITAHGIELKLFFENLLSTYSTNVNLKIKDWAKKLYINVVIGATQATLTVNGKSEILTYTDSIVASDTVVVGGGVDEYQYLIDGIAFYSNTTKNKINYVDDPGSFHSYYATLRHGGVTTLFDGYRRGYKETYNLDNFLFSPDTLTYTFIYYITGVEESLDYIIVKCNDENVEVEYDIDLDDSGSFTEYLLVNSITDSTIRFIVAQDQVDAGFEISIEAVYSSSVLADTPANLVLTGMALYSDGQESIVNYPDGVKLDGATYTGTWIESTPKSVEIIFKPTISVNDTYVFFSTDGDASFGTTGAINNYTAYLNGVLVTDLDDVKYDQWNHLVLTIDSPSATEFYLNSNDGTTTDENISYMSLTAYPAELVLAEVQTLYQIISGTDKISVEESALTIEEGTFDNGYGFNYYSYAWSIVGAGGQ